MITLSRSGLLGGTIYTCLTDNQNAYILTVIKAWVVIATFNGSILKLYGFHNQSNPIVIFLLQILHNYNVKDK